MRKSFSTVSHFSEQICFVSVHLTVPQIRESNRLPYVFAPRALRPTGTAIDLDRERVTYATLMHRTGSGEDIDITSRGVLEGAPEHR